MMDVEDSTVLWFIARYDGKIKRIDNNCSKLQEGGRCRNMRFAFNVKVNLFSLSPGHTKDLEIDVRRMPRLSLAAWTSIAYDKTYLSYPQSPKGDGS